jgi:hypothetical protein
METKNGKIKTNENKKKIMQTKKSGKTEMRAFS